MAEKKKKKEAAAKPLEKMTVKELREIAKEIPGITGVHGMNKAELYDAIRKERGVADTPVKGGDASVRDIKKKIRTLKVARRDALEAEDRKKAGILRRRISRLKKKTRRAA